MTSKTDGWRGRLTRLRQWWCGLWGHSWTVLVRRTPAGSVFACRDCGKERFISKWDRETP